MRPRPAPLWFLLCLAVVLGYGCRLLLGVGAPTPPGDSHPPEMLLGFWGFLITVGSWIFRGLQVAAQVTLTALAWSVKALWAFATAVYNGLKASALFLRDGLIKAWDFLEAAYDHVLKPVWTKFWRWFDKFRQWLDSTFGPILEWLRRARDELLRFWKTYVRPWLDLIDVTRRVLRVLNSLGLSWAGALDRRLGEIQDAIERPFRLLLQKVNEVINIVNRVVTLDGLLQRVALIRSIERDVRYVARSIHNWRLKPLTAEEWENVRKGLVKRTEAEVSAELGALVATGAGPLGSLASEMAATWRNRLQGRQ